MRDEDTSGRIHGKVSKTVTEMRKYILIQITRTRYSINTSLFSHYPFYFPQVTFSKSFLKLTFNKDNIYIPNKDFNYPKFTLKEFKLYQREELKMSNNYINHNACKYTVLTTWNFNYIFKFYMKISNMLEFCERKNLPISYM